MEAQPQRQEKGRLSNLRKFVTTPEDAEIVKEMIKDGLTDEEILHALGHVNGVPASNILPNGHEFSNVPTEAQRQKEEQAANGQPGGDGDGGEGAGDEGDDVLSHVAGLLTHVAKGKAKKPPQQRA